MGTYSERTCPASYLFLAGSRDDSSAAGRVSLWPGLRRRPDDAKGSTNRGPLQRGNRNRKFHQQHCRMVFGTHRVQGVPDAQGQAGAQGPLGPQGTPGKKASKVDNGDSATTSVRAVQTDGSVSCDRSETLVSVLCPSRGRRIENAERLPPWVCT